MELFRKIADAGILGVPFEEKYGGFDGGYVALMIALEEIARVCPSVSVSTLVAITLLEAIKNYGSEELKEEFLERGIAGEFRGSLAFTEPGTGSDPQQITTTAKHEGEYFTINGTKRFITNAVYDGPILLFAKDKEVGGITAFIADKKTDGYSLSEPWDCVGMTGSAIYDVFLDDFKVHESRVLGKRGEGFSILLGTVAHSKVALCATFVGCMSAAYELAVKYAVEKIHRDKPIGVKFPSIQIKIAKIAGMVESCRLITLALAEKSDDRSDLDYMKAWVGMTKAHVSDTAVECVMQCMNVLGAYGVTKEYQVERYMRDAMIAPHIEGVSDLQRVIAGSYILRNNKLLIQ
jgi:alkylation response protein AidB-like acyl-CoA dehydrogenase